MQRIQNILVPTDFSEGSRRAAEVAADLAKQLGARVTLLHVFHLPTSEYGDAVYATVIDRVPSLMKSCEAALYMDQELAKKRGVEVATVLRQGNPAHEIVEAVKSREADLVVIATHGRRGVARALLGSVAEKVVRSSPAPVMTIHAFDEVS